jgi:hypothetical protein
MTEIEKSNSLTDLAARIRAEDETIRRVEKDNVQRKMAIGDMLNEAKEQLGHGEWMPWLKDTGLSQRTANKYMRLAKNRKVIEARGDITELTLNAATRLLAPPQDEEEKQEDVQSEAWDNIKILYTGVKVHLTEVTVRLQECKDTFSNAEEFKAWLQKEFPVPDFELSEEEEKAAKRLREILVEEEKEMVQLLNELILSMRDDLREAFLQFAKKPPQ